jgi:hypothetical protein
MKTCGNLKPLGLFTGVLLLLNLFLPTEAAERVTLAWDPNPEPDIAGYKLRYGLQSRKYTTLVDVGNVTNATVSGLVTSNVYYFVLTAYNTVALESDYSAELVFTNTPSGSDPFKAPLDDWRSQYFTSAVLADPTKEATMWGNTADPDQDGQNNLWEYATAQNPILNQGNAAGVVSTVELVAGDSYLCLAFPRRNDDPELQYVPEVSGDRQTWVSGSTAVALFGTPTQGPDPAYDQVKYRDLVNITADQPRFMRLKIIR